jgi:16S rRNA (cytosine1402-N4)-methyltransferase
MSVSAKPVYHVPVLGRAIAALATGCRRAVDGTVGGGGHAEILVAAGAAVLAIDRDPQAVRAARARLPSDRTTVQQGEFADPQVQAAIAAFRPDLVLLDLGMSSHQLDDVERGFSFRRGVSLDMRMSGPGSGPTAAHLLNSMPESELARMFRDHADERHARWLARAIVARRRRRPFQTSDDLVAAIRTVHGPRAGPSDFARLFQALRMEVNDERGQLARALPALLEALAPGGRLVVISYHSGEDRLVKTAFREWARSCACPPRQVVCNCRGRPLGTLEPRRPLRPAVSEAAANPRARSAVLRGFRKADAS